MNSARLEAASTGPARQTLAAKAKLASNLPPTWIDLGIPNSRNTLGCMLTAARENQVTTWRLNRQPGELTTNSCKRRGCPL